MLYKSQQELELHAELCQVLDDIEDKQNQRLEKKQKLWSLHKEIKELWEEAINKTYTNIQETDSEEMKMSVYT